mmetsp:Transcript_43214/g.69889  ORF Transcript_43214/g.69889 Transcript_43214/m.69889 type:complete len:327 (-) Transcript_43214:91-1071(-)
MPVQRAMDLCLPPFEWAAAEVDRKGISATVQWVLLADLHSVVCKEEKDLERPALELRHGKVIKDCVEAANLPIPLHELLHVLVDVTTTYLHFVVNLLVSARLFGRSRNLDLGQLEVVLIRWNCSFLPHVGFLVVLARPIVTLCDRNDSAVDVELIPDSQVLPAEIAIAWTRKPMTTNQLALRHAAVLLLPLCDVAGVVLEVVHHAAMPSPEVLKIGLHDCLLEVAVEPKDVPVQHIPCRGSRVQQVTQRRRVIFLRGALAHAARPPASRLDRDLHKLWLFERSALGLLDADSVHQLEANAPSIVSLLVLDAIAWQVRDGRQIKPLS